MNCEQLREKLTAEPAIVDAAVDAHVGACPSCRAFRARLMRAEALIGDALRFDVGAVRQDPPARVAPAGGRSRWLNVTAAAAATLVVAVTFFGMLQWRGELSAPELAAEVAGHWHEEPESWVVTDTAVSGALLAAVLDGEAELDRALLASISYAESCWVAGQWVPHLVVQGEQGPYMVLLMPGRTLESPIPLEVREQRLHGHILPAGPGGSVAVLGGGEPAAVEAVEVAVVTAVDWAG